MTSSWLLQKRKEMGNVWGIQNFGDPNNALGGWEDHYITPGHTSECHPNYEAIPIGNPYGFMVCKKRKYKNGRDMSTVLDPIDPSRFNGYHKYRSDIYRPWREKPIQITDPYKYELRTIPNESYLQRNDYIARPLFYSGTGIQPIHTPGDRKYYEYGYSYNDYPPYKYDITQLHQRYPVWKEEKKYLGYSQNKLDKIDKNYFDNVTISTL